MNITLTEQEARKIGLLLAHLLPIASADNQAAIQRYLDAINTPETPKSAIALLAQKRAYVDQLRRLLTDAGKRTPTITGRAVDVEQIDDYIKTLQERCFNEDVSFPTFLPMPQ